MSLRPQRAVSCVQDWKFFTSSSENSSRAGHGASSSNPALPDPGLASRRPSPTSRANPRGGSRRWVAAWHTPPDAEFSGEPTSWSRTDPASPGTRLVFSAPLSIFNDRHYSAKLWAGPRRKFRRLDLDLEPRLVGIRITSGRLRASISLRAFLIRPATRGLCSREGSPSRCSFEFGPFGTKPKKQTLMTDGKASVDFSLKVQKYASSISLCASALNKYPSSEKPRERYCSDSLSLTRCQPHGKH
jgi:hypothetical protein